MWIMLIRKLPVDPSPPMLSIFWSVPLGQHKYAEQQLDAFLSEEGWEDFDGSFSLDEEGDKLSKKDLAEKARVYLASQTYGFIPDNEYYSRYGDEPNWVGARKINYRDQEITVFPHEFSAITHANMSAYIGVSQDEASHELIPATVAEQEIQRDVLTGPRREVYDASLVDGCNPSQAHAMALGVDVSKVMDEDGSGLANFPAVGWYRCKREYAEIFCEAWEMEEANA